MTLYFAPQPGHLNGIGSDALIRKFLAVAAAGNTSHADKSCDFGPKVCDLTRPEELAELSSNLPGALALKPTGADMRAAGRALIELVSCKID
jgi:hypothetical protein